MDKGTIIANGTLDIPVDKNGRFTVAIAGTWASASVALQFVLNSIGVVYRVGGGAGTAMALTADGYFEVPAVGYPRVIRLVTTGTAGCSLTVNVERIRE